MFEPLFGPITQWGFLVKDIDAAMKSWVEHFGVGPWWGYRDVRLQSEFRGARTEVHMHVGLAYQNGVQIELIQQLNDVVSPYRFFYDTDKAQTLHQLSYIVPDLDAALARAATSGLREHGVMRNHVARYVYLDHPAMEGLVVELMQSDPDYVAGFRACAAEAASWDGSDPYRLVAFG
ncbi:MAG: VOC family protein [Gammaproteobacteria bacterium]|nr:VOC family protein [Gammaproteobacteria bacterium]